jgi:hypothetical protein
MSPAILEAPRTRPATLRDLINPTERQQEFFEKLAQFDFVLYEGEASGGKSYALRWWLVDFLVDCYQSLGLSSVVVGLFSEDYPTLKDRHISKIRVEFPPWLGSLTRTDGGLDFKLRPEYGSGSIALRNLDDPSKYFSAEFAAIAVEELTRHPLSVFNDLRFRLRWPGIERPKFAAGTNPGGPGHGWVKKYWITKDYPPEFKGKHPRTGEPYDITNQFARVTAKASDNPYLSERYHTRNLTLPPDMAKRVAHGNWDIFTGQYFPYFDPRIHVIPHAEALARIKPFHVRTMSGDWGYDHPHCFHWHARDERNIVITYDELWDRCIHETEVGRRITTCEAQYHQLAPLRAFVFVWDAGKLSPRSKKDNPKSIEQLLKEGLGPRIPRPFPADSSPGTRIIRARLMSQALGYPADPERGLLVQPPVWFISDRCTKLIEAIPEMIRDTDHEKPEEMAKKDWSEGQIGDDPVDSAGSGLQWMLGRAVKPDSVKLEEKIQSVREQFLKRSQLVQPPKPGTNWFAQFGGTSAKSKK